MAEGTIWTSAGPLEPEDDEESDEPEPPPRTSSPFPPKLNIHPEIRGKMPIVNGD